LGKHGARNNERENDDGRDRAKHIGVRGREREESECDNDDPAECKRQPTSSMRGEPGFIARHGGPCPEPREVIDSQFAESPEYSRDGDQHSTQYQQSSHGDDGISQKRGSTGGE